VTALIETVSTPLMNVSVARLGAGTPLLYLHDVLFDLVTADGVAPKVLGLLADRREVVAPALPGFRDLKQLGEFTSIEDYVLLIRDLVAALDLRGPDVVGTGLGGWAAAELAALYPTDVGTLTLVNAFGLRVEGHPTARFFDAAAPNALGGRKEIRELLFCSPDEAPGIDLLPDFPDDDVNERYFTHIHAAARIGWQPPAFYDLKLLGRLSRVVAPTHIVWGAQNRVVDVAHGRAYEAAIAGATLTVVEGAGQAITVEQPDELARVMTTFLEKHGS
jgi:pimeloyl-ACP methyl ester carboxylesterase